MIVQNYSPFEDSVYFKVREFGDGEREVMVQRLDIRRRTSGSNPAPLPSRPSSRSQTQTNNQDAENRMRSARRAGQTVRHRVKAIKADRMLTLTYRENQTDWDRLTHDFKRFIRRLRKSFPQFEYVAVPERQKRGAWHMHLAIRGRMNAKIVRSIWLSVVGQGNVDITNPYKYRRHRHKLACYLAKYLVKAFGEGETNMRRVWSSRGIKIPPAKCWGEKFTNWNDVLTSIEHLFQSGDDLFAYRIGRYDCFVFFTSNRQ